MPYVWPRSDQNEVLILCHYLLPSPSPQILPLPLLFPQGLPAERNTYTCTFTFAARKHRITQAPTGLFFPFDRRYMKFIFKRKK